MDPLSILAAVVGLSGAAASAVTFARTFLKDAKGAKQQATRMIEGLMVLLNILETLSERLQSRSELQMKALQNSILQSTVESCRKRVDDVKEALRKSIEGHRLRIAVGWPLSKKDHEESLRDISVFAQWIQLALTVDDGRLLSMTLEQVVDLKGAQSQAASVLNDVNGMSMPDSLTILVVRAG